VPVEVEVVPVEAVPVEVVPVEAAFEEALPEEPPHAVRPIQASNRISRAAAAGPRLLVFVWGMELLCRRSVFYPPAQAVERTGDPSS